MLNYTYLPILITTLTAQISHNAGYNVRWLMIPTVSCWLSIRHKVGNFIDQKRSYWVKGKSVKLIIIGYVYGIILFIPCEPQPMINANEINFSFPLCLLTLFKIAKSHTVKHFCWYTLDFLGLITCVWKWARKEAVSKTQ